MRRLASGLLVGAGILALMPTGVGAAATTWDITRSPSTMDDGDQTAVTISFTDLGGPSGNDDLGCVWLDIPASFVVASATVTGKPSGTKWSATVSGNTTVVIKAKSGGDRLDANAPNDSVTTEIVVTAQASGAFVWNAHAHIDQHCTQDYPDAEDLAFTVRPNATPTPTPTPSPTPTPKPTPTATATATPTPVPTASVTPTPTASATPRPTLSPTPTPTPAPTATLAPGASLPPTSSATPTPSGTTVPDGQPTPSPEPTGSAIAVGPLVGAVSSIPPDGSGGSGMDQPGSGIAMPGVDGAGSAAAPIELDGEILLAFGNDFQWVVPGLVLSFPGLLILLFVALQAVGALAWVPVVRRRLGGTDPALDAFARRTPGRSAGQRSGGA